MEPIKFSPEEKAVIINRIRDWFAEERDEEMGPLPAEMLLNFFSEEIGGYFYNRGLQDAQALLAKRMEDLNDEFYGMERRTGLR